MTQARLLDTDTSSGAKARLGLRIWGAVQGVGFRPMVARLAQEMALFGFVCNTCEGVSLEVEGDEEAVARFAARVQAEAALPARIDRIEQTALVPKGEEGFVIRQSAASGAAMPVILPDLATCDACRSEVFDPANRRYRYPFTTCTHCGPRFSVIEDVPYDRCRTAMRHFPMCRACEAEYSDPASGRFHAETIACADCGPELSLCAVSGIVLATGHQALMRAANGLCNGQIIAVKGIGGFQLMVDARSEAAVARLRRRKCRPAKPFAVMAGSLADAEAIAKLSPEETRLLHSAAAPVVLVRARKGGGSAVAANVAPANPNIGLMLPTSPLHHLLMAELGFPLVTTSGNASGEPLATDDGEAIARLSDIADLFLTHDRPIVHPVDDSVVRVIAGEASVVRSARGYAPLVLTDRVQNAPLMATGGHLKSAIALAGQGKIVLGPHISDLHSAGARERYDSSAKALAELYRSEPTSIVCDAHPGYFTTRFASAADVPVKQVQHHLAHVLSAVVDNALEGPVLGVAWDGTGFGADGTIWGGEFLVVERDRHLRAAHLLPFRLPGGEAAMREPRRSAIGALHACFGDQIWERADCPPLAAFAPEERHLLAAMVEREMNCPLTSSAGRLFDAVAAVLGLSQQASFEGEAAMAVEFAAGEARASHDLPPAILREKQDALVLDWRPMLTELDDAAQRGVAASDLAAGFHAWLARAIVAVSERAGVEQVALTGGCFQNALLAQLASEGLLAAGFTPYRHTRVPAGDGGLAVGQAAAAARCLAQGAR